MSCPSIGSYLKYQKLLGFGDSRAWKFSASPKGDPFSAAHTFDLPPPHRPRGVDQAAGDPCVRGSASGVLGVIVNVHPLEVPLHVPSRAYRRRARRGAELQHHTDRWIFRFEQQTL